MSTYAYTSTGGGTTWLALVSLGIAVLSFLFTLYWNRRMEKRGYLDQFWFRQIFAPSCLVPVIDLRKRWSDRLAKMQQGQDAAAATQKTIADFGSEKNDVLRSLWVSKLFFDWYYDDACIALDHAEDVMAEALQKWRSGSMTPFPAASIDGVISKACMQVVETAARLHGRRLRIRSVNETGKRKRGWR